MNQESPVCQLKIPLTATPGPKTIKIIINVLNHTVCTCTHVAQVFQRHMSGCSFHRTYIQIFYVYLQEVVVCLTIAILLNHPCTMYFPISYSYYYTPPTQSSFNRKTVDNKQNMTVHDSPKSYSKGRNEFRQLYTVTH